MEKLSIFIANNKMPDARPASPEQGIYFRKLPCCGIQQN